MKEVVGFKKSYVVSPVNDPEEYLEPEVVFNSLDKRQRKYLNNAIERRGGKVVDALTQKQGRFNARTKKMLRNSAIYFGITYLSSLGGIQILSPQLGVTIVFFQALVLSSVPASSAFLTRLAIELKIE